MMLMMLQRMSAIAAARSSTLCVFAIRNISTRDITSSFQLIRAELALMQIQDPHTVIPMI